jgi:beta-lactam-binding protein with PASTA domain
MDEHALAAAGLQVGTVANYRPGGVVMTQDPTGDKKVPRNSQVDLVLSQNGRGP